MAVVATNLTNNGATGSITSQATASIAPAANNLILATVSSRNSTVAPNVPTATGNGLTWVQVATDLFDNSGTQKRITVFRAMGASPSTGAITFDFASQTQTDVAWSIDQFSGIDTTGTNGSGAIVQSVTGDLGQTPGTTLTVTLAAFSSVNNATFGGFGTDSTGTMTAGSGFSILAAPVSAAAGLGTTTEFSSTNNTAVGITDSNSCLTGGIAIEIKAAVAAFDPRKSSEFLTFF